MKKLWPLLLVWLFCGCKEEVKKGSDFLVYYETPTYKGSVSVSRPRMTMADLHEVYKMIQSGHTNPVIIVNIIRLD